MLVLIEILGRTKIKNRMKSILLLSASTLVLFVLPAFAEASQTPTISCINLSRNLYLNQTDATTNGEVTRLQHFLSADSSVYPSGRITGYFGPLTEAAVQRWQAKKGIVSSGNRTTTGFGYVGPKTRVAMGCSGKVSGSEQYVAPQPTNYSSGQAVERHSLRVKPLASCGNGNDFYDGGEGMDALTYSGKRSEFFITLHTDGSFTFKDLVPCRADTDTVINFESFVFADGNKDLVSLRPDVVETPATSTTPPSQSLTNSTAPSCSLSVTTTRGTHAVTNTSSSSASDRIMAWNGESLSLRWGSINATQVYNHDGAAVGASGTATIASPQTVRTYQYQFSNGSGIATCSIIVYPVSAGIDSASLVSTSPYPIISGFATGVSNIEVVVRSDVFSTVRLYDNLSVQVVNGRWSTTVMPALKNGTYHVDVYGPVEMKLNYIISGELKVNSSFY